MAGKLVGGLWDKTWVLSLLVALAGGAAYFNTLSGPFLGDDVVEIQENPRVHSLAGIPALFLSEFTGSDAAGAYLYRPLAATVTTLNWNLGGGSSAIFHAWNILIHATCSGLVFLLALDLGAGRPAALLGGLMFGVHPIHTEAVAWISGHSEMMTAAFVLSAWLAHRSGRPPVAACLLALALLSKESAVVFPAVVLASDLIFPGRSGQAPARGRRRRWAALAAYAGVVAVYMGLRWMVLGRLLGGAGQAELRDLINPLIGASPITRVLTSIKVVGVALQQSLFPATLCFDYGYNQLPVAVGPLDAGIIRTVLMLLTASALAWVFPALRAWTALGFALFLLTFLPASNLLFPGVAIFAERNLYLPVLGIVLVAALLLGRGQWGWGAGALLIALMGAKTITRNQEYLSPMALSRAAVAACPNSAWVHHSMGVALRDSGDNVGAEAAQRRAASIAPQLPGAHSELGLLLMFRGRDAEAEQELREAVRLRPEQWEARSNLALVYARTGRLGEGLREYSVILEHQPNLIEVEGNYAALLIEAGRVADARAIFEKLSAREPASAVGPNGLGGLASREGRWDEAARWFGEAVRRDPNSANAIYNHALALTTLGRVVEARVELERAAASGLANEAMMRLLARLRAAPAATP